MKSAGRRIGALLMVLCISVSIQAAALEEDPQSLWSSAQGHLERGEIQSAQDALARLESLVAADPHWDPDGSYSEVLMPSLSERIARIQQAVTRLNTLQHEVESGAAPPASGDDLANLRSQVKWTEDKTGQIQSELEEIADDVPNGIDRGSFLQSGAFDRTGNMLESSAIPRMTADLLQKAELLVNSDERARILQDRLNAVKKDLIASSVSRKQLERKMESTLHENGVCRTALFDLGGVGPEYMEKAKLSKNMGEALASLVRVRLAEVRTSRSQTPLELAVRLEDIKRFRTMNSEDLGGDSDMISGRIDALEEEVRSLRVVGRE